MEWKIGFEQKRGTKFSFSLNEELDKMFPLAPFIACISLKFCQTKVMPFTTTFLHSIFSLFFPLCFQGLCFECGSDGKQCAKVGYSAIDYKSLSAKRKQTNLKFFFNTGRTKPFCRKSPNKCSALIISAHRFFSLLQNITI